MSDSTNESDNKVIIKDAIQENDAVIVNNQHDMGKTKTIELIQNSIASVTHEVREQSTADNNNITQPVTKTMEQPIDNSQLFNQIVNTTMAKAINKASEQMTDFPVGALIVNDNNNNNTNTLEDDKPVLTKNILKLAIQRNKQNDKNITELSMTIERDFKGRTDMQIHINYEQALKKIDKASFIVVRAFLERIADVKAEEIAAAPMCLSDQYYTKCPMLDLGSSEALCYGHRQTNGTVWAANVDDIRMVLLKGVRDLFDRNTDVIVAPLYPTIFMWPGFCYINVHIVNTALLTNPHSMMTKSYMRALPHVTSQSSNSVIIDDVSKTNYTGGAVVKK
jgi:hypothetical protein